MHIGTYNWAAIAVCLLFNLISGSVWYGPKTFFPMWWKAIGKKPKDNPNFGTPLTWSLIIISGIIQVVFVSAAVNLLSINNVWIGLLAGFSIWLGTIAPAMLVTELFPGRYKAWAIEVGYYLINYLVFGAVLGVWR